MKTVLFISFLLMAIFPACNRNVVNNLLLEYEVIDRTYFLQTDMFQELWTFLSHENRIDTSDAMMIKMLSSNSFVAFEQTPDSIVAEKGKIEPDNIHLILEAGFQDEEIILIVTEHLGFCHAFQYNPAIDQLKRYVNNGPAAILAIDSLIARESTSNGIYLIAENEYTEPGDWIKYYCIDIEGGTFAHTKNCRSTILKIECNEIEPILHIFK